MAAKVYAVARNLEDAKKRVFKDGPNATAKSLEPYMNPGEVLVCFEGEIVFWMRKMTGVGLVNVS